MQGQNEFLPIVMFRSNFTFSYDFDLHYDDILLKICRKYPTCHLQIIIEKQQQHGILILHIIFFIILSLHVIQKNKKELKHDQICSSKLI